MAASGRTIPWDWHPGVIPDNVVVEEGAYIETTYSFELFRGQSPEAMRIGRGSTVYSGVMFDVGPKGRVDIGAYTLLNGGRFICDELLEIGDYCFISWNVVFMDAYRLPFDPEARRAELMRAPHRERRRLGEALSPKPISIGRNVWIGFDACILPGVTIGECSIVGARSVVFEDIEPYTVVAGNPARFIRRLEAEEIDYNEC